MLRDFLAGLTIKRALLMAVPILFSLGASAGIVKGIEWLIESPRPKMESDLAEDAPMDRTEEDRSVSRSPASLSRRIRSGYRETPPSYLNDSGRDAPLSQSAPPPSIVEENVNNHASFPSQSRASPSTPDASSNPGREEQIAPATSPSYYGGASSGLAITDTPDSGGSSDATSSGGTSSDPESNSLSSVAAASLSGGGFALTITSSGHMVNASYGVSTNIVRATTSSGHEIRMNTPGVTAD